jgi:DNA-directed RNA polymerase subunit RPC12/RpoP
MYIKGEVQDDRYACSRCGEQFETYELRDGRRDSPVAEVDTLHCPNGHVGRVNYDHYGHISQTTGVIVRGVDS